MKPAIGLTDAERFPLIKDLSFLYQLKQDVFAPRFNFESGDRLTAAHLEKVKDYEQMIRAHRPFHNEGTLPGWLPSFVDRCRKTVLFYKNRNDSFISQPTIKRQDIQSAPWLFVSDDCTLDDLLVYQTSGTTGPPMDVIFDPVSQACWLPQLQSVLDRYHITLTNDPGKVAIALICSQSSTLTYASLSAYLYGAGVLKINLYPGDWNDPAHRAYYLEKYDPEILTGDPFAFLTLLDIRPNIHPKAIVSSAMKLSDAVANRLKEQFRCPVLDVYSLTECRMVAFAENQRHRAIRPDLYLEVFDADKDILLPDGERGELVITGGNNPFLPLIRYRTGDFCSLRVEEGVPYLAGLEARAPVIFYSRQGCLINNIEISRALTNFPLAGFTLHQKKDKSLSFTGWSNDQTWHQQIRKSLEHIFGNGIAMNIFINSIESSGPQKPVSYSSEFGSF